MDMRNLNLDEGWEFRLGAPLDYMALKRAEKAEVVNLPHDYMIAGEVLPDAPAKAAMGYYTGETANYVKRIFIPEEWKEEQIILKFDGIMMNATVEVNGGKVALHHNGYTPFEVDITKAVYCGMENRICITVNPSMQPNSRWYTGAGIFRSVELIHKPWIHIAGDGIYAYTEEIEYDGKNPVRAYLKGQVDVVNQTMDNYIVDVKLSLIEEQTKEQKAIRTVRVQVNPNSSTAAHFRMTVENPLLWDCDNPNLYIFKVQLSPVGIFKTHLVPGVVEKNDEDSTLFGIRTVRADAVRGLQINGRSTKLKGGCLHHDNGVLGAVSLYDSEVRKVSLLKKIGFNAIRTAHNPPSKALMEACARVGMYVFDEAFDAWGMGKQPGDYNQFFDSDWKDDVAAYMRRDRSNPAVIIWSTGNEIPERGGLNNGYTLATEIAEFTKELDGSRPVSNGICSFWNGLDDFMIEEQSRKMFGNASAESATVQNADVQSEELLWEEGTVCFTNGLDIVGYNYLESKYERDHELYPDRVILGSENFPKKIGIMWPMVERLPYVIGDFTWTAYDYIGEAGIGKTVFVEPEDPMLQQGPGALMSHSSQFPWRLANDSDYDINGNMRPQGAYRSVIWGSGNTYLYISNPGYFGRQEIISMWGFTDVTDSWNWSGFEGKPVRAIVFSNADRVELRLNGRTIETKASGESEAEQLPKSFVFELPYEKGVLEAVSYAGENEISKAELRTTGVPAAIKLEPEREEITADGHSLAYVAVNVVDEEGNIVPDSELALHACVEGAGILAGFGSSNPITDENYTTGNFKAYKGKAMAVVRSGYQAGEIILTVKTEGFETKSVKIVSK